MDWIWIGYQYIDIISIFLLTNTNMDNKQIPKSVSIFVLSRYRYKLDISYYPYFFNPNMDIGQILFGYRLDS